MDLNGQFVGWRHDHDLGRSLRRIDARKEGQQISQCFTGTRLRSQIRVLAGNERRNCGDLNGAGVGNLLLRERNDQFGWQRQVGKLHEFPLATDAGNTHLSRGMVAGRALILAALRATPVGGWRGDGERVCDARLYSVKQPGVEVRWVGAVVLLDQKRFGGA